MKLCKTSTTRVWMLHTTPYRKDWQEKGYYVFVHEDFHLAYRVYRSYTGEKIVRFHDACHSLLNYNPEDALSKED